MNWWQSRQQSRYACRCLTIGFYPILGKEKDKKCIELLVLQQGTQSIS